MRIFAVTAALALALGCMADIDEELDDDRDRDRELEDEPAPDAVDDDGVGVAAAPARFRHPGVLVNSAQLDLVRGKVRAGAQPWKAAYDKLRASEYGQLSWTPRPRRVVNCGARSNPNEGCSDERRDAVAAYSHALLWYIDRDRRHADKAIAILDAWARVIERHTGHNAPLQTGWSGAMFPAAAEILRHSDAGWSAAGIDRFSDAMRRAYLPTVIRGNEGANGNWELIMTEAALAISVFLDDRASFDRALALWRRRVPAYMYLAKDGDIPLAAGSRHDTRAKIIKYWHNQTTFRDGIAQETCRDLGHTQWGIAAAIAGAETAYHQGVDLYRERDERLRDALEFHARYMNGAAVPSWLCGGRISNSAIPTWEIAYNHFHDRMGHSLPESQRFIRDKTRTDRVPVNYFIAWETLTHAGVGRAGF